MRAVAVNVLEEPRARSIEVGVRWHDTLRSVHHVTGAAWTSVLGDCDAGVEIALRDAALWMRRTSAPPAVANVAIEQGAPLRIDDDTPVTLRIDDLVVTLRLVPRGIRAPRRAPIDARLAGILAAVAALAASTIVTTRLASDRDDLFVVDRDDDRLRELSHLIAFTHGEAPVEHPVEAPDATTMSSRRGAAHDRSAGALGRIDATRHAGHYTLARHERDAVGAQARWNDGNASRGIFAALGPAAISDVGNASTPFGAMRFTGRDATTATGAMTAPMAGDDFGFDGLGRAGIGLGGGGGGIGTIGIGPLGTVGAGAGACGCGEGMPNNGLGIYGTMGRIAEHAVHRAAPPEATRSVPRVRCASGVDRPEGGCDAMVEGLLDPSVVRRVVRRNIGQIAYCHELALRADPTREGRVSVRFVIDAEGSVIASEIIERETTVPEAGPCIAAAVRRWTFPSPANGGVVRVTYPFRLALE